MLKPMPEDFENIRTEYNKTVDDLLMAFLELSTEDKKLLVRSLAEPDHMDKAFRTRSTSLLVKLVASPCTTATLFRP